MLELQGGAQKVSHLIMNNHLIIKSY